MSNYKRKRKINEVELVLKHRMNVDDADKLLKELTDAFVQIFNHNASTVEFGPLYSSAYNMVLHKHCEKLYSGFVTTVTAQVKQISESLEEEATEDASFLEKLNREWIFCGKAFENIAEILMYMDKTYVISKHKTPVLQLGLNLWTDHVIHSSKIQTRLLNTLLEFILTARRGEAINNEGLMRNTIKMLTDLGSCVYQDVFEKPFLEASADFYRAESLQLLENCDCSEYLKTAERRLNEERWRVSQYEFCSTTEPKITYVVQKEMIANHLLRLVHMQNSGLVNMLVDDRYDDLRRMYDLFSCVDNGLSTIIDVMSSHVKELAVQLVIEFSSHEVELFQRLLGEANKYDKIIRLAFNNDQTFQNAMNASFGWNFMLP